MILRSWIPAALAVVVGCSLLNEDRGPKLDCNQNPQARACANGVLGVCQGGQAVYEICTDEGKACNVVNGQPVCGTCQPACDGKSCGPDGCGGVCGTCSNGSTCTAQGMCTSGCVPDCSGKMCGADGCGGSCGTCASDHFCVTAAEDLTATHAFVNTCQAKCFFSDYTTCIGSAQFSLCMNPESTFNDCPSGTSCTTETQDGSSPCH